MVLDVMGAMLPPMPPSDATELRLSIASRTFYQHPAGTAVLRLTRRAARQFPTENTGSTLRVMSTLMCARVTSLDSAQALPMYREGSDLSPPNPTAGVTLPRPPLRTFCPKNPTKEKRSPWTLSLEEMRQRIFCIS